ncbi:Efflux pump ustT-like protein [Cladobotryum mycophilum]|uniref:Efflux pump ustT-like protein n=1 Tax=Cladobotryum mycophilum TaxID=491253 RepID=A0ABR0SFL5_9HYPO
MPDYDTTQAGGQTSGSGRVQLGVDSVSNSFIDDELTSSPDEESLLLDNRDEEGQPVEVVAPESLRRLVISLSIVMLLLLNLNGTVSLAPLQMIMEDIICRKYYPENILSIPGNRDELCKTANVQKTLAMVRSWVGFSDLLTSLFVQIPYGVIADKYGRRPVLMLALIGGLLNQSLTLLILFFPSVFSIWCLLFPSLLHLVGGSVLIANAVIYTLITDITLPAERGIVFSRITAVVLLSNLMDQPMAASLMKVNPWIPMWMAYGAQAVAATAAVFVPETIQLRRRADKQHRAEEPLSDDEDSNKKDHRQLIQQVWAVVKNDVTHVWSFIIGSKDIMLFVFAFAVCTSFRASHIANLLQYITLKFNWEWSTAAYVYTISDVTSITVFLLLLPLLSNLLANRFGFEPLRRDLLLARTSVIILSVGSLMAAAASVPWTFIGSLVIGSLGEGYSPLFRAVLNSVVEPHTIATLNTVISTANTLVGMVATPAFGWLLSKGIEIGGSGTGLPYFVACVWGVIALVAMSVFRIPTRVTHRQHEA